jgi:signal transduction histidine kinase/CheY-like chemotaxis protein
MRACWNTLPPLTVKLGIVLLALLAAVLLRKFLLAAMGTSAPWITFYPAVMVTSLYSGLVCGLLSTCASCLINVYGWHYLSQEPFIRNYGDWLGLIAFVVNCIMIAAVCELARRERLQAIRAKEEAEAANRAKSVFLANMSHELRTPLNAILGFPRLMQQETSLSARQRHMLDIVVHCGEHLLALINNVLEMSKIESGHSTVEFRAVNLSGLLEEVTGLMSLRAQAKGLKFKLETAEDLPALILADESKVKQIIINLVGNAVKFTRQGSVTLRLHRKAMENQQSLLLAIEVEDSGPGIAAADRERIFEPFVQLDERADEKGTGLGLAITRQFVQLLKGEITLESTAGGGSKFKVTLPVRSQDGAADALNHESEGCLRLRPGQAESRILIVEDQPENSLLLSRLLEQAGFVVRIVENGVEAVEAFASWRPCFIWMDWRMPVMDGLQATRIIRDMPGGKEVKIAVLSASVFKEDREQVLAAGADDFHVKPFQFKNIFECMAKQLAVEFISAEPPSAGTSTLKKGLDRGALAALPFSVRKELAEAIVSLDRQKITSAIRQVSQLDSNLGSALDELAGKFHYTRILQELTEGQTL